MYQRVNVYMFRDGLLEMDRTSFSNGGAKAMFEYLEEIEISSGNEKVFDPIKIDCEWTEYASALEALQELHPDEHERGEYDCINAEEKAVEWFSNRTETIVFLGGFIIKEF